MSKHLLRDIFAKNIRALRRRKSWTQGQLAKKAKITGRYVSLLEQGDRNITLDTLEALARAFDVPATELISDGATTPQAKASLRLAIKILEDAESKAD